MNQNPSYITGDRVTVNNLSYILRSVDFVNDQATLEEDFCTFVWPPVFKTVRIGLHKTSLDLEMFREVTRAKVDYVTPRVAKTGKFKLPKTLLKRLQTQLEAI